MADLSLFLSDKSALTAGMHTGNLQDKFYKQ
jgi:hypothetical protein